MGRNPKQRDNYRKDGIAVHVILTAIEQDPRADPRWVAKIAPLLKQAVPLLLSDEWAAHSVNQRKAG